MTLQQTKSDDTRILQPKVYLNGFPKSGLHLAELMTVCLLKAHNYNEHGTNWFGTFTHGSWSGYISSNALRDAGDIFYNLPGGHYVKGHCAYHEQFEIGFREAGIAVGFIYRDLRDVAVSQVYHILSDNDIRHLHPGKDVYRALGSKDAILKAVIVGLGDDYPGLLERWQMYAGWLDVDWVAKLRFEDMIGRTRLVALEWIRYIYARTAAHAGIGAIKVEADDLHEMADMICTTAVRTDVSPTFRKGIAGEWRKEFSAEHKRLFKERAGDWLIKLGYEDDNDW